MRVTYTVGSYNTNRYGYPWIARVAAWEAGTAQLVFGRTVSEHVAEIEAGAGDVIRFGQRDHRKIDGSTSVYGIVQDDGSIVECSTEAAREHWLNRAAARAPVMMTWERAVEHVFDALGDERSIGLICAVYDRPLSDYYAVARTIYVSRVGAEEVTY